MRQWGGHSLASGQSVVLVVDNKAKREAVAEELKTQLSGKVSVFEQGSDFKDVSNVDAVISYGANIDNTLRQALQALKPGGFVALYVPISVQEDIIEKLVFSGFVGTKSSKFDDEFVEYSSSKPDWEVGASQKLNLKRPVASQDAKNVWSNNKAEDDIIDEDSLLDESDRSAKPSTKADDCEVGKTKKACKNCTCGRADEPTEAQPVVPKLTKEMIENPGVGSSCGSCGLGDAFRCGGCPYRGLPAFKVGEKISIPDNFMEDDI